MSVVSASACAWVRGNPSRMNPACASGLRDAVANDLEHGRIVDQLARGHDGVGAFAELGAILAMLPEDVAGRDLRNVGIA